jgi:hypothetical protein
MRRLKEKMGTYRENKTKNVNKLRLRILLEGAYPHGVQGVENP